MAVTHGMNIESVRQIGAELDRQAGNVDQLILDLSRLVFSLPSQWRGRDSDEFRDLWTKSYRPTAQNIRDDLKHLAQVAKKNAGAQLGVSAIDFGWANAPGQGWDRGDQLGNPDSHDATMLKLARAAATGAEIPGWKIVEQFDLPSGLQATLYRDAHGHMVLSYRGSTELKDWENNAEGIAKYSGQQDDAVRIALEIQAKYGDATSLEFAGHSLGGGLASLASLATGQKAVTFDAAGVSTEAIIRALNHGGSLSVQDQVGVASESIINKIPGVSYLMQQKRDDMLRSALSEHQITAYAGSRDPLTLAQDGSVYAPSLESPNLPVMGIFTDVQSAIGDRVYIYDEHSNLDSFDGHNIDIIEKGAGWSSPNGSDV
ncbi:MAG: WXG100 family type VII secretion target [Dermatophilaceae bacterium]